jgi:pimeloyl-ACP methyl ester carboxylesterase
LTITEYICPRSYSGGESFPEDILNRYVTSISKPGFLRALFGPFAAATIGADNAFFNRTLRAEPLQMPVLALGGEASTPAATVKYLWGPVGKDVTIDVVPKAGHWLGKSLPFVEISLAPLKYRNLTRTLP